LADHFGWSLVPNADEVLSALPQILVQVDADFRITAANRSDSPIFRRPPGPGDRLEEVFRGRTVGAIAELIDKAQRTGSSEGEVDTGTEEFRVTARRLETAPWTLLMIHEKSGFESAERVVVDLVRERSNVLVSVSDELRTPLSAVLGYANLLAEPDSDLDEVARTAMVQDMTDQAWDLAGIVEDLLAVARAEIGDLNVVSVPVNLIANVAQVIESMGSRGREVKVLGDKTITGHGDPARFRQIVRNLLSNALTHGAEPVSVDVHADDAHAALRVTDRGPGVPEPLAEAMFEHHVTGKDLYAPGRVGIGLWISRELTSLMGGRLTYRRVGGETVFQVTLPR